MARVAFICSHAAVHTALLAQAPSDTSMLRVIDNEAKAGASGYEWLRWSCAHIGHRLTGSPNGAKAEALADRLLRYSGLEHVSAFPFTTSAWSRDSLAFHLIGRNGPAERIASVALANTPVQCSVQLDLLDAGNGLRAQFEALGPAVHGKAVIMNLGLLDAPAGTANLHRSEKTALAIAAGAAAAIFVNTVEGGVLLTGTASIDGRLITIPAICISSEAGARIRARLVGGEQLRGRIDMGNRCGAIVAHNVLAEIPGSDLSDEVLLVGGHLDSWDLATGATDNGLGSYSIIDLARCFSALAIRPRRTIRFVLFMGEEQGLLGSRALVAHYREVGELEKVRAMVNLDMSGHPQGFQVAGPAGWSALVKGVNALIQRVDTSYLAKCDASLGLHSDHQPFMLAGIPTLSPICDLGKNVYRCYHSDCDDIALVDPGMMVDNVRYVGMLLYVLAMAEELPGLFTMAELKDRLIAAGLEEPLRLGGDWPWPDARGVKEGE